MADSLRRSIAVQTMTSLTGVNVIQVSAPNSTLCFMHRLTGHTETVIIEYGFLDNATDHNHYKNKTNFYGTAEAVVEVICKELGIPYRKKGEQKSSQTNKGTSTLYRVQTGAFSQRENALKHLEALKKAGFDAFITD